MMKDEDFKLLRGFDNGWTDEQTDKQTFVIVELLSRLKAILVNYDVIMTNLSS